MFDAIDIYQQVKISQANSTANRAENIAERFESRIEELQRQVERLIIVNQAVWELLKESNFANEDKLLNKIEEIDLRDGSVDGKISQTIKVCQRCHRNSNSKRLTCLYCGEALPDLNVFEAR